MAGRAVTPKPDLDDVDRRLLELLMADGRLSVNELARRAGISRATAYTRYDRLVASGAITGFRATVDPHALGLGIAALIFVNVQQGSWPSAQSKMLALPGIEWLGLTSGGFDMVLLVRFANVETLRDVVLVQLHGMKEVRSTQTVFLLDEYRPTAVTPPT